MDQCNESLYFMPKSRAQKSKISLLSLARRGGRKTLGSEPRSGRPTCSLVRRSHARTADEIRNDFGADATVFTTTFSDFVFLVHGGRTTSKVRTAQAATRDAGEGLWTELATGFAYRHHETDAAPINPRRKNRERKSRRQLAPVRHISRLGAKKRGGLFIFSVRTSLWSNAYGCSFRRCAVVISPLRLKIPS